MKKRIPWLFPTRGGDKFKQFMESLPDDYSSKIRIIASISNDDWEEDLSHYNIEYAVYTKRENPLLGNWRNVASNYLLSRPMEDDLPFYLEADDDFIFKKKENLNRNFKLINDLINLAEDNSELVGSINLISSSGKSLGVRESINTHFLCNGILLRTSEIRWEEIDQSSIEDQTITINARMRGLVSWTAHVKPSYLPYHKAESTWSYNYSKFLWYFSNVSGYYVWVSILGDEVSKWAINRRNMKGEASYPDFLKMTEKTNFADRYSLGSHDMSIICKYMEHILTSVKDSMGRDATKLEYDPNIVDDWDAKGRRGFGELHPDVGKKTKEIPTIPCGIQGIDF